MTTRVRESASAAHRARAAASIAVAALVGAAIGARPARAELDWRVPISAQVGIGLSAPLQSGLDHWLDDESVFIEPQFARRTWPERFDPSVMPSLEVGARVTPHWSLGFGLDGYQTEIHRRADVGAYPWGGWGTNFEQGFQDVAFHFAWWPGEPTGAYVGGQVGSGTGRVKITGGGRLTSDVNDQLLLSGLWKKSIVTWGVYVGWQAEWSSNPRMDLRAGWLGRDLGEAGTTSWGGWSGPASGPLRDRAGAPVDLDFSGPFATLSFVFVGGGKR
jgi:hypothetical protein